MRDDRFEWDDDRALLNFAKHRITFNIAKLVFEDQTAIDELEVSMDYAEDRYKIIGMADGRLVSVIYTLRLPRVRIISARKATSQEQRDYAERNRPA